MTAGADLAAALEQVLGAAAGHAGVRVEPPVRLGGGASRETWAFDAVEPDGARRPCILRRDPPGAPRNGVSMDVEASLLTAARDAGVPVPRVLASGDGAGSVGTPFVVVERIEGETIPRRILRDAAFAAARPRLVTQMAEIAARIHAIAPAQVPSLPPQDPLAEYRAVLDAHRQPHPAFELAFAWLGAHRPPPGPRTVVHGDYRLGNLLVDGQGVRGVLDWELAHLGDPVEDLGWMCVRSWRFGAPQRVAGLGGTDELLAAYARAGGIEVDPRTLLWWEMMGTLRWGVICVVQAATHLDGAVRSVELATIGRRVCEVEWDLLTLLDEVRAA